MIKYKLVNILKQLESLEWNALRKYLLMYTRAESDNYKLFEVLRQYIAKINSNEDMQTIHSNHFAQMSAKSFTNMLSRVTVWTEDWIVHEEVRRDRHMSNGVLLKYYNRKGLYKEADNTALKAEKSILNEKGESLAKFRHLANIYHAQYYSNNPIKYKSGLELIQKIVDTRLEQYGCQLAAYKLEVHNWKEVKSHDFTETLNSINHILKPIENNVALSSIEAISEVFVTRESKNLHALLDDLENEFYKSNTELELLAASYLTALSLRLWGENKLDDPQLILKAYEYSLESGILLSFGKIPLVRWYNILSVMSTVLGKNKSIEFLNKWISIVSTDNEQTSTILSMALIDFHTENYIDIYRSLSNIKYSSISEKLRSNQLIAISLYMQHEKLYDEFIDHCKNSLRTLKRHRGIVDKQRLDQFENLIVVLKNIVSTKFIKKIYQLELPNNVMHKKWLSKEIKRVNDKMPFTL